MLGRGCEQHEAEAERWRAEAARLVEEKRAVEAERDGLATRLAVVEGQLAACKAKVAELTHRLFAASSERAGRRAAEPPEEPTAEEEATAAGDGAQAGHEPPATGRRGHQPGAPGHGRRRYDHLPTTEVVHQPGPDELCCPSCGAAYEPLPGEDRAEELSWRVEVRRVVHRRPRWRRSCDCPQAKGVVTAPPPPRVIPKGRFSAGALARLVVAKYVVGLPCARLVTLLSLEGLALAPGSLAGTLRALGPLLAPLAGAIRARNASAGHLHVDETSWKVFEIIATKANHRWWLWVFVGPDTTSYVIKPSRGAGVVAEHLGLDLDGPPPILLPGGAELLLSSDFYTPYQRLGREVAGIINIWCWAHMRRYFMRAGKGHRRSCGAWAEAWTGRIGRLFAAHHAWGLAAVDSLEEARAGAELLAVVAEIDAARAAEAVDPSLPDPAAKVLATLERQWVGLTAFLDHPGTALDNNVSERGLRGPVVGRKNYYGSGAVWSAALAADAWTITATVAQAGWNPLAHLEAYLGACAEGRGKAPQGAALEPFLPWTASAEQAARFAFDSS